MANHFLVRVIAQALANSRDPQTNSKDPGIHFSSDKSICVQWTRHPVNMQLLSHLLLYPWIENPELMTLFHFGEGFFIDALEHLNFCTDDLYLPTILAFIQHRITLQCSIYLKVKLWSIEVLSVVVHYFQKLDCFSFIDQSFGPPLFYQSPIKTISLCLILYPCI